MKISYAKIYVDDQEKALSFYTEKLGFIKKADVSNSGYRWLTVVSPEAEDGVELILEKTDNPAAKTFQEALFTQKNPAANFDVDDVQAEYDRMSPMGVKFTSEPAEVMPGVNVAIFEDTCGNLIQIQKVGK